MISPDFPPCKYFQAGVTVCKYVGSWVSGYEQGMLDSSKRRDRLNIAWGVGQVAWQRMLSQLRLDICIHHALLISRIRQQWMRNNIHMRQVWQRQTVGVKQRVGVGWSKDVPYGRGILWVQRRVSMTVVMIRGPLGQKGTQIRLRGHGQTRPMWKVIEYQNVHHNYWSQGNVLTGGPPSLQTRADGNQL